MLPHEVLLPIFEHVGREDLLTLLCLKRVCMRFSEIIDSEKSLQALLFFIPSKERRDWEELRTLKRQRQAHARLEKYNYGPKKYGYQPEEDLNPVLMQHFSLLCKMKKSKPKKAEAWEQTKAEARKRAWNDHLSVLDLAQTNCLECGQRHVDPVANEILACLPWTVNPESRAKWLRPEASWRRMLISKFPIQKMGIYHFEQNMRTHTLHNVTGAEVELGVAGASSHPSSTLPATSSSDAETSGHRRTGAPTLLTIGRLWDFFLSPEGRLHFRDTKWELFFGKRTNKYQYWRWYWNCPLRKNLRENMLDLSNDDSSVVLMAVKKQKPPRRQRALQPCFGPFGENAIFKSLDSPPTTCHVPWDDSAVEIARLWGENVYQDKLV